VGRSLAIGEPCWPDHPKTRKKKKNPGYCMCERESTRSKSCVLYLIFKNAIGEMAAFEWKTENLCFLP
jgi:hypothetical protein